MEKDIHKFFTHQSDLRPSSGSVSSSKDLSAQIEPDISQLCEAVNRSNPSLFNNEFINSAMMSKDSGDLPPISKLEIEKILSGNRTSVVPPIEDADAKEDYDREVCGYIFNC